MPTAKYVPRTDPAYDVSSLTVMTERQNDRLIGKRLQKPQNKKS